MTSMPTHDASSNENLARRTLRLLERQRDALRRVEVLARQQRLLIDEESTDALLGLMAQRQTALQDAAGAGEELVALRQASGHPGEHAGDLSRLRAEIDALVRDISARDEDDRRALERKRERVLTEMAGLAKAKEAATAYGVRESGARYQDREG